MARYGARVPTEDFSEAGKRVFYTAKYRGQDLILAGTIVYTIWDRNYGQTRYRIQPDELEEYGNLTHYQLSMFDNRFVKRDV